MWLDRDRAVTLATVALVVLAAGLWATGPTGPLAGLFHPLQYEHANVTVSDTNGSTLATVDVRVADTDRELYVGLSKTDSLPDGEGMLFVHESTGEHAYVMRDMNFPLDIVFAGPNGTITTIHHAAVPSDSDDLTRYRGRARYVLEVPRGYTNATGIEVGDRIVVPEGVGG